MSWDKYFHNICNAVASNSKCLSRKIGTVIVKDKSIISTGYNGPSRNVPNCRERLRYDLNLMKLMTEKGIPFNKAYKMNMCPRYILGYESGEGLQICVAAHSETNCIADAARHGKNLNGCTLYLNTSVPCKNCMALIINAGIKEVVCEKIEFYNDFSSEYILDNSKLKIREFDFEEE